jgi:TPP-dependent trihydroxycyclohexane-1,2-dione (THcHDO) dehydratase
VPAYEAWWEVVPAEASEQEGVRKARQEWSANKKRQRHYI